MRNELPTVMTVAETAAALSVSTKTVRRMLEDGRLVAHRFGSNVRVSASSVMHMLWAPAAPASGQQVHQTTLAEVSLGPRLKYTNEFTGELGGMLMPLGTPDELEAASRLRAARRAWNNIAKKKDQHAKLSAGSFIVHDKGGPRFIKFKSGGSWKSRRIPSEHVAWLSDPKTANAYALRWAVLQACVESGPSAAVLPSSLAAPPVSRGETTVADVAKQWFDGELSATYGQHYVRPKKSARDDANRFRRYIEPVVGNLPIASLRGERAAEAADRIILRMQQLSPGLSAATQRHVLQIFRRILKLAVFPLRLLPTVDLPSGYLPSARSTKAFSYLYPSEEAAVLACRSVPLHYRVFFGILAREGMRASELRNLTWSDLDLDRGVLRLDSNKTGVPRAWRMDPSVTEALVRWRGRMSERALKRAYVVVDPERGSRFPAGKVADRLKEALAAAGVDRAELFQSSEFRMAIRGHDLRSTFVTVSLALGKTEAWVTDRTGHTSSAMVYRYKRAARTHLETELGPVRPLHEAIPELAELD